MGSTAAWYRSLLFGLCLFGLCFTSKLYALDFYHASVLVKNQSAAERARAAGEGLRQVLVRVSGSLDAEQSPAILNSLSKAASYVDQYQYELERDEWGDKVEHLSMSFSPPVIERLLKQASLPFWPINRPKVLVWLVEDHIDDGKLLINDPTTAMLQGVVTAAEQRGIPLMFPLLDLDDQLAISADSVWGLDEEVILAASERYRVDTVLVGRYTQTSTGQWWATWQFFHRGDNRVYDMRSESVDEIGRQAIGPVADYLASLYAIVPNAETAPQLVMQVSSVKDFGSFKGLLNYLQGLAVVTSFNLISTFDDSVLLALQLNGGLDRLNNAISLDAKIREEVSQATPLSPWIALPRGSIDHPLRYQWVKNQ